MQSCFENNGHLTAQRTKEMDSVNRHTARERPDLLEWRKCQGKAGWYGMLAILVGGSVVFAGLSGFPKLPKKYLPLVSLGVGAGCGWFVSYRVITSCRRGLSLEGTVDGKINQSPEKKNDILLPPKETKYGDKGFVKE
ncbi:unnamed protein product [Porites lobata]|uniref:Transmembrane protein n=1 Tax=Porites lobata TaxID=104759 RepID=A0ABN8NHS3_9CNID|nr:unnamed protein product [Porites lobata]